MKEYYINKKYGQPCMFVTPIKNVGTTREDYFNGKWILVRKKQKVFYEKHPEATFDEIMATKIKEQPKYIPTRQEQIVNCIRQKYSIDDELGIQRQRETKITEFEEYNRHCEECKSITNYELQITN
jgi:hypothetical protein